MIPAPAAVCRRRGSVVLAEADRLGYPVLVPGSHRGDMGEGAAGRIRSG